MFFLSYSVVQNVDLAFEESLNAHNSQREQCEIEFFYLKIV